MKRMFLGMLATETNTFSPVPTGPNVWKESLLVHRLDPREQDPPAVLGARALLGKLASERGWEVAEGLFAFARSPRVRRRGPSTKSCATSCSRI